MDKDEKLFKYASFHLNCYIISRRDVLVGQSLLLLWKFFTEQLGLLFYNKGQKEYRRWSKGLYTAPLR